MLNIHKQQGAALVIGLIVLMILTIIGIASMQSSSMEEKMAANIRDLNLAFQSSETALREAETTIEGLSDTSSFGSSGGYYSLGNAPDPFVSSTWTGSSSVIITTNVGSTVIKPRYFIELIGTYSSDANASVNINTYGQAVSTETTVFRIVARGTGATGTAQVMLEEFYGKNF